MLGRVRLEPHWTLSQACPSRRSWLSVPWGDATPPNARPSSLNWSPQTGWLFSARGREWFLDWEQSFGSLRRCVSSLPLFFCVSERLWSTARTLVVNHHHSQKTHQRQGNSRPKTFPRKQRPSPPPPRCDNRLRPWTSLGQDSERVRCSNIFGRALSTWGAHQERVGILTKPCTV